MRSCDVCHWGFFVIDCTDGELQLPFGLSGVMTLNVNIKFVFSLSAVALLYS